MTATISNSVGRNGRNVSSDVRTIQELINGHIGQLTPLRPLVVDGRIGSATIFAIEEFQRRVVHMSQPDGRVDVGGRTLAALNGSNSGGQQPAGGQATSTAFPPRPSFSPLVGNSARAAVFGRFDYVHEPVPGNAENIRILGNWESNNIVTVSINMGPNVGTRRVRFHQLASRQLQNLWEAWNTAGLLDRVLTYSGAFVPRFVRGSTSTLSNHAFGSAFDINVAWNGLGRTPALVGSTGSVRELVPIANEHGFYWGGHFSRLDGMHFEIAQLI